MAGVAPPEKNALTNWRHHTHIPVIPSRRRGVWTALSTQVLDAFNSLHSDKTQTHTPLTGERSDRSMWGLEEMEGEEEEEEKNDGGRRNQSAAAAARRRPTGGHGEGRMCAAAVLSPLGPFWVAQTFCPCIESGAPLPVRWPQAPPSLPPFSNCLERGVGVGIRTTEAYCRPLLFVEEVAAALWFNRIQPRLTHVCMCA